MGEKMTLEQVRDWHREQANLCRNSIAAYLGDKACGPVARKHDAMADAIDAHLTQQAQGEDRKEVFVCSNPQCGVVHAVDPCSHCPACVQENGVGWSTMRRRYYGHNDPDDAAARFEAVAWRVSIAGEYKFFLLEEDAARERQEYEDDVGADWLEHEAPEPLYLRAARADLSEEVRELMDDARWMLSQLPHNEFSHDFVKDEKRCDTCKRIKRIAAAIAKVTHP